MMAFAFFDTKHKRMRIAIEALENAVENKRTEVADAEGRLRETLKEAKELKRLPIAGSLVWKGRRDG